MILRYLTDLLQIVVNKYNSFFYEHLNIRKLLVTPPELELTIRKTILLELVRFDVLLKIEGKNKKISYGKHHLSSKLYNFLKYSALIKCI